MGFLKKTFKDFGDDRCMDLSAALSYYTIFAIGPLLVMVISILSLVFDREIVTGQIFEQMAGWFGAEGARTLQEIVQKTYRPAASFWAAVISGLLLIYAATGIFMQIQSALNFIWSVKPKPKRNLQRMLRDRLQSFGLLLGIGFLLTVSLLMHTLLAVLGRYFETYLPMSAAVMGIASYGASLLVYAALFAIIFKVLPDVRIRWRYALRGGMVTAFLFAVGQALIAFYLSQSKMVSVYGTAASFLIFIVWVNYSSAILYFGAEFTKNDLTRCEGQVRPAAYAVLIERKEKAEAA
jgi:membrane protein